MSSMLLSPLHPRQLISNLGPASWVDRRLGSLREANQITIRQRSDLHGGTLRNQSKSLIIDVIKTIALQMVAHIVWGTGTSVHAGGGDADGDETGVVGVAGGEIRVAYFFAGGGDVVVQREGAEGVAGVVALEDFVERDEGSDHVVVVVEANLVGFGFGEVACVVP